MSAGYMQSWWRCPLISREMSLNSIHEFPHRDKTESTRREVFCVCALTCPGQVPTGFIGVLSVPDGCAHRADQRHDQQDPEQNQDLHVGHPLHIRALQWHLCRVLKDGQVKK